MSKKEFVIPFVGLKLGVHEFEFEIADAFFEGIEYSLVQKGKVNVKLSLEKKETMLIGLFTLKGVVETACGRCTEAVDTEIEGDFRLVYKFDDVESDDESLVIVYPEEFEIDVKESILEFVLVSLPSRTNHAEGQCNEEITDILSEYQVFSLAKDPLDEFDEDDDAEAFDSTDELEDDNEDEEEINDQPLEDDEYVDPRWAVLKGLKDDGKPSKK